MCGATKNDIGFIISTMNIIATNQYFSDLAENGSGRPDQNSKSCL